MATGGKEDRFLGALLPFLLPFGMSLVTNLVILGLTGFKLCRNLSNIPLASAVATAWEHSLIDKKWGQSHVNLSFLFGLTV